MQRCSVIARNFGGREQNFTGGVILDCGYFVSIVVGWARFCKNLRGRLVPELLHTGISQYRELISAPWRIVYRVERQQVLIMAVLDSRRDLQAVLLNRLAR